MSAEIRSLRESELEEHAELVYVSYSHGRELQPGSMLTRPDWWLQGSSMMVMNYTMQVIHSTLLVAFSAGGDTIFPLEVSENHHYLVNQQGKPFLIHGDSPWESIWQLTKNAHLV